MFFISLYSFPIGVNLKYLVHEALLHLLLSSLFTSVSLEMDNNRMIAGWSHDNCPNYFAQKRHKKKPFRAPHDIYSIPKKTSTFFFS